MYQEMLGNDSDIPINQIGRIALAEIGTSLNTVFKIAKALIQKTIELFAFEMYKLKFIKNEVCIFTPLS